jgi:hypothetical protein
MKLNRQTLMERAGLKEEDKFYDADKEQKNDEEDMPGAYDDDGLPLGESLTNMDPKANKLHMEINKAINKIDDSLSYKVFADAVALMLEDGYGTHNFDLFQDHLRMQLNTFRSQDK